MGMPMSNGAEKLQLRIPQIKTPAMKLKQIEKLMGMQGYDISMVRQELLKLTLDAVQSLDAFKLLKKNLTDGRLISIANPSLPLSLRESNLKLLASGKYELRKEDEGKDVLGTLKEIETPLKDLTSQAYDKLFGAPAAAPDFQPIEDEGINQSAQSLLLAINGVKDSIELFFAQAQAVRNTLAALDQLGAQRISEIQVQQKKIGNALAAFESEKNHPAVKLTYDKLGDEYELLNSEIEIIDADIGAVAERGLYIDYLLDHLKSTLDAMIIIVGKGEEKELPVLEIKEMRDFSLGEIQAQAKPVDDALLSVTTSVENIGQIINHWERFRAAAQTLGRFIDYNEVASEMVEVLGSNAQIMQEQVEFYATQIDEKRQQVAGALKGTRFMVHDALYALEHERLSQAPKSDQQPEAQESAPSDQTAEVKALEVSIDPAQIKDPFAKTLYFIARGINDNSFSEIPELLTKFSAQIKAKWQAPLHALAFALDRIVTLQKQGSVVDKGNLIEIVRAQLTSTVKDMGNANLIAQESAAAAVEILEKALKSVSDTRETQVPREPKQAPKAMDWSTFAKMISNGAPQDPKEQADQLENINAYLTEAIEIIRPEIPELAKAMADTLDKSSQSIGLTLMKSGLRKKIFTTLESLADKNPKALEILELLNSRVVRPRTSIQPPPPPAGAPEAAVEAILQATKLRDTIMGFDGDLQKELIPTVEASIAKNDIFNEDQKELLLQALEASEKTKESIYASLQNALVEITNPADVSDDVLGFAVDFAPGDSF